MHTKTSESTNRIIAKRALNRMDIKSLVNNRRFKDDHHHTNSQSRNILLRGGNNSEIP